MTLSSIPKWTGSLGRSLSLGPYLASHSGLPEDPREIHQTVPLSGQRSGLCGHHV